jgi:hypothetical protein
MFDSHVDEANFHETVKNIQDDNERVRRKFVTTTIRDNLLNELLIKDPALKARLEREIEAKLVTPKK